MTTKNKLFRPNSLLLVLIVAGFIGACSRDDFPEKIVEPTIVAPPPSTMGFMPAEAVGQLKKVGAEDLTAIATDDPLLKKILVALQANDDKTLRAIADELKDDLIFCPGACYGAHFGPSEEVGDIEDKIYEIGLENPAVFMKLAEYSQRVDNGHTKGWYESAIKLGSQAAEEKLAALAAAEKDGQVYLSFLAEVFAVGNTERPSMDAKKGADYLGKALAKGVSDYGRERAKFLAAKLIKRNGPDVTAPLWPLLLEQYPNPHPATAEAKAEALKTCVEMGGHPDNPVSGKAATSDASSSKKEVSACRIVIETDENNRQAMANLGYALSKGGDVAGTKIAYARAAEMGDSWAIVQYWSLRYRDEGLKKAREALTAEAAAGNPWANMEIGLIASGSNPRDKDTKLFEEQITLAASKNIPAAQYVLANIKKLSENFDEAMKLNKQAAHNGYAPAMFDIGTMYEEGKGVSKDSDHAKKWYGRAAANGDTDAKAKLAKLEAAEKTKPDGKGKAVETASVTGEWMCDSRSDGLGAKAASLFGSNGLFAYKVGTSLTLVSRSYKVSGAKASGYFEENNGRTVKEPSPYEVFFSSVTPDKLVFELKIKGKNGESLLSNECVPLSGGSGQQRQQSSSGSSSSGDRVADYANNLASQMERSSHPACQALANNIRTFGNSGAPEVARERQVEAIVDKAPSFCF